MFWILVLAILLRLPLLTQSLWLDESIQALALQGYYGSLWSYALSDFQPPLYHYLLKGWTSLAGFSEPALRAPALLAGVALVYYTVKLGQLLANRRVGIVAGLLAATNPLLIYYSAEGRTYILTALFVTASFYYLFRLLKKNLPPYLPIYYALYTTLALWSSYLAWFAVLLQLAYLVRAKRWDLARLALFSLLSLVFWLPSFTRSLTLGLSDAGQMPEWGRVVGGTTVKALALTWVKTAIGRISFSPPLLYYFITFLPFLLHAHIIRHLNFFSRPSSIKHWPLLLLWLFGSIALSALISLFVPAYSYTRVLFVVPAYLLLLAVGSARLRSQVWIALVILLQLVFTGVYYLSPRFHKEDWRGLVTYLNQQEGIVVQPSLKASPPLIYYGLTSPLHSSLALPLTSTPLYYLPYTEDIFDPGRVGRANLANSGYTLVKETNFNQLPVEIYEN